MVQLPPQWKSLRHVKEPTQDTHQVEVPLCRDGIAIAVVCDAVLKGLRPSDREVLIFEA